jgi:anti-sigma B factor antagonist
MSLDMRQREKEGIAILDLKGRLTVGEAATALREEMSRLSGSGHKNIILDLAGVEYIDSTGLGTLVVCYNTMRKAGGALKLLNLNRRNTELLILTKLSTVFEMFDDEQQAVNSFFPGREIRRFDILSFVEQSRRAEEES